MVTRTQLDRLTSRVEQLATVLEPETVAYVPIYRGESRDDALAAYDEERGSQPRAKRIEFNRVRHNWTRAKAKANGIHKFYCQGLDDLSALIKSCDGYRSLEDYRGEKPGSYQRKKCQTRGSESVEDKD